MKKVLFVFLMLWALVLSGQEARLVLPVGHSGVISAAIFSPNNKLACTISDKDETPIVWDVESGKMLYKLKGHEAPVNFVTFSPSGTMIYTQSAENVVAGERDNTVRIWETKTGKEIRKFKSVTREIHLENNLIGSQVFSPDEKFIIVPNKDSTHVWELSTSKVFQSIQRSHTAILGYTVSGDSKIAV